MKIKNHRLKALGCLFVLSLGFISLKAAAEDKDKVTISFSGYIKTDVIYDTRQTVSIREGHFLLYPKDALDDPAGKDINAKDSFHILSIQTRMALKISGPRALGAKTSGYLEGEFFGVSDADINGFRLRHAYLKLNWRKSELMIGQFWHPMFITESYPEVVSFNTGAPFEPFSRAPQVRFTWNWKKISFSATALSQRDFASTGPEGISTVYFRNAAGPEFNFKLGLNLKNLLLGGGINLLKIVPRLATETGYQADESVTSAAGFIYSRLTTQPITIKAQLVYGGNLHHLTMLGGYAAQQIVDPIIRNRIYTPINTGAAWLEIQTNGEKWQAGLFSGYCKNLGATKEIIGPIYSRGDNIARLFRLAPRFIYNAGKIRLAEEIELTSATYGSLDNRGQVSPLRTVSNIRLLTAFYYFF
ncbi:MAG TPA: hypothetical protein ENO29_07115 [Candidatus Aminicenantes bacterium]|nr:MAG: hypothetical protein C0168_06175 [Candidatus Aminicenantes bacterium]HEK86107.1 hypothetical protein [Candidatus Aminicenantes bacterium]